MDEATAHRAKDPLLAVSDLHVEFALRRGSPLKAVDGVSLALARGSTLGIVGESGSGKSTLARAILRLIPSQRGSICFERLDVRRARGASLRQFRRDAQMMFQDTSGSLNPRMRIGQIISEPLRIQRRAGRADCRQRTADLLALVGMEPDIADRYPHEFSGGQRQRIGLARALALSPKLLILDEPVSALDVSVQAQALNMLADLQSRLGLSYVLIAHSLAVAGVFSDQLAVMYAGRIVETAAASELFRNPMHPYTLALLASTPGKVTGAASAWRLMPTVEGQSFNRGCALQARCPRVSETCRRTAPPLENVAGGSPTHLVACHHAAPVTLVHERSGGDLFTLSG